MHSYFLITNACGQNIEPPEVQCLFYNLATIQNNRRKPVAARDNRIVYLTRQSLPKYVTTNCQAVTLQQKGVAEDNQNE